MNHLAQCGLAPGFDVRRLVSEVRALARANPQNVYTEGGAGYSYDSGECSDGSKGCIVGQGMRRMGVDTAKLGPIASEHLIGHTIAEIVEYIGFTGNESDWLAVVQDTQDTGHTWREAVAAANEEWPL